jgi:hypothetical protein
MRSLWDSSGHAIRKITMVKNECVPFLFPFLAEDRTEHILTLNIGFSIYLIKYFCKEKLQQSIEEPAIIAQVKYVGS